MSVAAVDTEGPVLFEGIRAAANTEVPVLFEDIRPVPTKQRASLGVVELTLDEGQSVRAFGVVYGLEHTISGDGYRATLFLDQYNQRIKIIDYQAEDMEALVLQVRWIAEANGFDKIICMASRHDWLH
ncbi:MAG TPA: hypothetical protein VLS89_19460, partial [Candidatus Nanopelagicales bacterium]|nr:hypothetical protein [Candidatus Nanopelagicales bacterium]